MAKVKVNINNMARRSDLRISDPHVSSKISSKERRLDVQIVNLSRRGLRFKSNTVYKLGDKLRFELNSSDENSNLSLSIRAKIINDYGSKDEGVYDYGVRFFRLLYWYEMNCIHDYVYQCEKK